MKNSIFSLLPLLLVASSCALFESTEPISPEDAGAAADAAAEDVGAVNQSTRDAGSDAELDAGPDATTPGCGDGVVQAPEACDDGNPHSHDGCSSRCTVESLTWTEIRPTFERSRYDFGMANSPTEGLIVFGGRTDSSSAPLGDTLRWDESSGDWETVQTSVSPPPMAEVSMTWARDAGIILFGGHLADGTRSDETWFFRSGDWVRGNIAGPAARSAAAMSSYDNVIYLFGGFDGSGSLDDFWLFEGGQWTRLSSASASAWPPARREHAMASSPGIGLVMFGGLGTSSVDRLADTWVYRAGNWELVRGDAPPDGYDHAMVGTDDAVFLFGGRSGSSAIRSELWSFDGVWKTLEGLRNQPTFRRGAQMVGSSEDFLLFGGRASRIPFGDLWAYSGERAEWRQRLGGEWPAGREDFGMVGDRTSGEVVLFGGSSVRSATNFSDTWIWNMSEGWREVVGAGLPERADMAAAYHDADEIVVMHGGVAGSDSTPEQTDTWGFDGSTWNQLAVGPTALGIQDAAMAYHPLDQTLYLYGGERANGYSSTLYRWETNVSRAWNEVDVGPVSPDRRKLSKMEWDPVLENLVVFGGFDGDELNDQLAYDGTSWRALMPDPIPDARASFGMIRHGYTGTLIVHAGSGASSSDLDDLWVWDGESWSIQAVALRPQARSDHQLTWSASAEAVVLFGGYRYGGGADNQGDMWLLRYDSAE